MPQDPFSTFGGLLRGCISDRYAEESKVVVESALFAVLGFFSALATAFGLRLLGL